MVDFDPGVDGFGGDRLYPNHGRVVLRPGDGVSGEDMLGVTLYDGEISMSVAEWQKIAWRILTLSVAPLGEAAARAGVVEVVGRPLESQESSDAQAPGDRERLTADDLRKMRERCDAATEGPWLYRPYEFDDWGMVRISHQSEPWIVANARAGGQTDLDQHRRHGLDPYRHNGEFIARARTDMPRLLDEVAALRAENERLLALLPEREQ